MRRAQPADVLPGVADAMGEVWVEATFDDGTRLVSSRTRSAGAPSVPTPLARSSTTTTRSPPQRGDLVRLAVTNTATVPISVTSHFHFFEVNPRLRFDRGQAYGRHLASRQARQSASEPGATTAVELAPIDGDRIVVGFAGLVDGPLDAPGAKERAIERARACGYLGAEPDGPDDVAARHEPAP